MDPRLIELGLPAASLSAEQKQQLDEQGFTVLPDAIDPAWLEALRAAFDEIHAAEGADAGKEVAQVEGVRRLADLVNKGEVFDGVYQQPLLLAAVWHVIGRPFKLHSINGHDPLQGHGQQALHADWGGERGTGRFHVVNSMWMLDDMTPDNGATRIVPGSQHDPASVGEAHPERTAPHPREVRLTGTAGSIGVFNGSAWHSCTENTSGESRRVLHGAFIAREHAQQTNQRDYLRPETERRLTPLMRYILDV
jgi:ectoine hydroxylase-related dioxygenase (phytanoyl-CoA dioxygenase family)